MMLGMLVFWAALAVVAVWAVSALFPARSARSFGRSEPESWRTTLDRRYAAGEISREEYEEMRETLEEEER